MAINRADWTKERIAAFKRYLAGDKEAKYHGRKKNGEMYKKGTLLGTLVRGLEGSKDTATLSKPASSISVEARLAYYFPTDSQSMPREEKTA